MWVCGANLCACVELTCAWLSDEAPAGAAEPGGGYEKGGRAPEGRGTAAQSPAAAAAAAAHYQGTGAQVEDNTSEEYVDC